MPHPTNPNIRCDRCKAFEPAPASTDRHPLCRREPLFISVNPDSWCLKFEPLPAPIQPNNLPIGQAVYALVRCRRALAAMQPFLYRAPSDVETIVTDTFWNVEDRLIEARADGFDIDHFASLIAREAPDAQT